MAIASHDEVAVPLRLRSHAGVLSFLSTVTVFGTAIDLTLAELSLEAFYPADEATLRAFQAGAFERGDGTTSRRHRRPNSRSISASFSST